MGWEWSWFVLEQLTGIEPYEVMQVLETGQRWPRPAVDPVTGLVVLTIWGRTKAGRPLKVATRPLDGLNREIVGARELTPAELAELEQWEATRDGD